MADWISRFLKGAWISAGFIVPGISGGAFAVTFAIYQRAIAFAANITKDFVKNALFFAPVALGGVFGMVILARPLSFLLKHCEAQLIWGFIGCIIGAFPALWRESGKDGRSARHYAILVLSTAACIFMLLGAKGLMETRQIPLNFATWIFVGALTALLALIPGLCTSVILVYFGIYKPMLDAVGAMDLSVLLPITLGGAACVFPLSALIHLVMKKMFAGFFHFIAGIVIASTIMIVPANFNYLSYGAITCAAALAAGTALGFWMGRLEEKNKE
jgi:putative membrane protein